MRRTTSGRSWTSSRPPTRRASGPTSNASLRTAPTAGAAFSSSTPDNDRDHHGPVVEILGQGAQPGNGADFRGFVALDIRNFLNTTSQIYYNDVPTGTTSSTLKDLAARWIYTGGYPGPPFVTPTTPLDAMDQVGLLNGNSTGAAIDALDDRFSPATRSSSPCTPASRCRSPTSR